MSSQPKLIAAGRASEVFDLGDGRVLRRFKSVGNPEREALVMRHARRHGYRVPEVLEVTADALVLEKVEGRTMLEAVGTRPAAVREHAAAVARLHRELHEIEAPEGLPAVGEGDSLLHLDLHPANVILSPNGPVVIDWTNARRGAGSFDIALTWVIAATSTGIGSLGHAFVHHFLSHFDRDELRRVLRAVADYRLADVNVLDDERRAIRELVAEEAVG
ncbi:MAG TPA: phosphotransferase [Gaiellaceae bacterium]|nr:phosphotransferase [Gaiellaceae bacterium]